MLKVLLKISVLCLLVTGTIVILAGRQKTTYDPNNYFAALIDKNNLLEKTNPPRIIFVGASNLAFGLDSKMIEKEFDMPVVNMGLHGDFGLGFILNNVKQNIKKGDIVVLAIEYYLDKIYYKDVSYATALYPKGKEYIDYNAEYYSQKLKYHVNEAQIMRQKFFNFIFEKVIRFKEAKVYIPTELNSYDTAVYSRSGFNSNGDLVSHLTKKPFENLTGGIKIQTEDYSDCIDKLNDFLKYVNEHGGRVYFTYPCYARSEFEKNYKAISDFEKQLKENMKIEIISSPEDTAFPDS
ncbi:MAG: hypothetical protein ABI462_09240, partial [Ignavibacteria bacterium]